MKLPVLEIVVSRQQMLGIWLAIFLLMPFVLLAMFVMCFTNLKRAAYIGVGADHMGNAMRGGDPRITISERVGNRLV